MEFERSEMRRMAMASSVVSKEILRRLQEQVEEMKVGSPSVNTSDWVLSHKPSVQSSGCE